MTHQEMNGRTAELKRNRGRAIDNFAFNFETEASKRETEVSNVSGQV